MSVIVANHKLIDQVRLVPSLVYSQSSLNLSTSNYSFSLPAQVVAGNCMVIISGGVQTRTPVSDPTSLGFTRVNRLAGAGTLELWYKISDGTEGTSIPLVWTSSLQGGYIYFELSNVDEDVPFLSESHFNSGGVVSGISNTAFTIQVPTFVVCDINLSAASTSWNLNNSFLNLGGLGAVIGNPTTTGTNSIYKAGYRIFQDVLSSPLIVSWTSLNSRTVLGGWCMFQGKPNV